MEPNPFLIFGSFILLTLFEMAKQHLTYQANEYRFSIRFYLYTDLYYYTIIDFHGVEYRVILTPYS